MITQEYLKSALDYNPETGVFTWLARDGARPQWNARYPGEIAGGIWTNKLGYQCIRISLAGKSWLAHRLAWLYMTGEFPKGCIDHLDRNATNNRWSNLKVSTVEGNSRNQSMRYDNTSGITGVHWNKRIKKWHAYVYLQGKRMHLGYFAAISAAEKAVTTARRAHGFSKGHGHVRPY